MVQVNRDKVDTEVPVSHCKLRDDKLCLKDHLNIYMSLRNLKTKQDYSNGYREKSLILDDGQLLILQF